MCFFRDILHDTKSTHISQIYNFFIIGKTCFAAGWTGFVCRNWPAGRGVENPDIGDEEEWWLVTVHTIVGVQHQRWTVVIQLRRQRNIFWTGIQLIDGQQEAPIDTVLPQHPQRLFTSNPVIYFPQVDKTCVGVFCMFLGFHKFAWEWKFVL